MDGVDFTKNSHERFFLILIASVAALGGFLFGYDTGIISGALVFIRQTYPITTFTQEVIVSSVVLGALLGALTSGRLTHAFGSRQMLLIMALTFILGTLLSACALSIPILILGRFIIGVAIGVTSYVSPLFIAEMAPSHNRGSLVLLNGIMITGGESLAFLVAYSLVPTQSWRWMFLTGLIPALLLLLGMLMMPASPRWMVLQGRIPQARQILHKIRHSAAVDAELQEIIKQISIKTAATTLLFSKLMYPVLIIGIGLGVLQQLVGINTVMYYGPSIFQALGFQSEKSQLLATFGLGLMNTMMTIVAVMMVDKLGRRNLLLGGMLLASLSLLMVGLLFYCDQATPVILGLSLFFLLLYIAGYCLSLGSLFWLIISEIYPLNVRSMAMSFVTAIQWAASFIVTISFLSIIERIGMAFTFWLYALMCIISFIFCYYWVPETTGVSLEQIEKNLRQGKRSRELGITSVY